MMLLAIAVAAFVPMVIEAVVSARHEAALRKLGAVEPHDDVYRVMQVAYPAAFAVLTVEAWLRHVQPDAVVAAGAVVFLAAKALKYWAINTLGVRWTFRVLVPPGHDRIVGGPYKFVRHPNYVAVIGELVGAAVMAHAAVTGPLVTLGFGLLMLRRIVIEETALGLRSSR
jgi:methyltransferase